MVDVGAGVGVGECGSGSGRGCRVDVSKAETWSRVLRAWIGPAVPRLIQAGLEEATSLYAAPRGSSFAKKGTAYMRGAVCGGLKRRCRAGCRALRARRFLFS